MNLRESKITAKGSHEGFGGRVLRLLVAVSFGKGVVLCEKYEKMTSSFFSAFIKRVFPQSFLLSQKSGGKLFVQDNDPSQTSAIAKRALRSIGATHVLIPPRLSQGSPCGIKIYAF